MRPSQHFPKAAKEWEEQDRVGSAKEAQVMIANLLSFSRGRRIAAGQSDSACWMPQGIIVGIEHGPFQRGILYGCIVRGTIINPWQAFATFLLSHSALVVFPVKPLVVPMIISMTGGRMARDILCRSPGISSGAADVW
jgi:hypothetical protein